MLTRRQESYFINQRDFRSLVFDNEICGQALHFIRETEELDDLPTADLVEELLREAHLLWFAPRYYDNRQVGGTSARRPVHVS